MQSPLWWGLMCCRGVPESGKTLAMAPMLGTVGQGLRAGAGEALQP